MISKSFTTKGLTFTFTGEAQLFPILKESESMGKSTNTRKKQKKEILMHQINKFEAVSENVEAFLTIVEESRKKKQLRDHLISLTMKHTLKTNDCEILIEQVGGRIGSISRVKNNDSGTGKNSRKPRNNRGQAKKIHEGTIYFLNRIKEAAQKDRNVEAIILEHNFERRITDLFIAYTEEK